MKQVVGHKQDEHSWRDFKVPQHALLLHICSPFSSKCKPLSVREDYAPAEAGLVDQQVHSRKMLSEPKRSRHTQTSQVTLVQTFLLTSVLGSKACPSLEEATGEEVPSHYPIEHVSTPCKQPHCLQWQNVVFGCWAPLSAHSGTSLQWSC